MYILREAFNKKWSNWGKCPNRGGGSEQIIILSTFFKIIDWVIDKGVLSDQNIMSKILKNTYYSVCQLTCKVTLKENHWSVFFFIKALSENVDLNNYRRSNRG